MYRWILIKYSFKIATSDVVKRKLHTHRRHINEETYTSVFCFVEYYILNHFCVCKTHTQFDNISDFSGNFFFHNVSRDFLLYVFRILFKNDPQQI